MEPKVSVIVPVYNVEQYLDRCVDSLLRQSLDDMEIILVDDGSPDGCPRMCDALAGKYPQIKVIHQENQGLGPARNSGLEIAGGEYVAFVDSDDFVEPNMYERLYDLARENDADFVGCDYAYYIDGKATPVHAYDRPLNLKGGDAQKILLDMLGAPPEYHDDVVYGMSVWKAIYRRSVIEQYGVRFPSREMISEDIIFNTEYLKHAESASYTPEVFYYYVRENTGSLTKNYKLDHYLREIRQYKMLSRETEAIPGSFVRLQRTFLSRIRVCLMEAYEANTAEAKKVIGDIFNDPDVQAAAHDYDIRPLYFPYKFFVLLLRAKSRLGFALYFKYRLRKKRLWQ